MPGLTDTPSRSAGLGSVPCRCILSNGTYVVFLTGDGASASWFDRWTLTPWTGGPVEAGSGFLIYLREMGKNGFVQLGSPASKETLNPWECHREAGRAVMRCREEDLDILLEICVPPGGRTGPGAGQSPAQSPEQSPDQRTAQRPEQTSEQRTEQRPDLGLELRRLRIRNHASRARDLEITTYGEVVLHDPLAHAGHPAFSRLFVHSEYVPERRALLFRRRARSPEETFPYMVHALLGPHTVEHETDRARFLGRGESAAAPRAFRDWSPLAGTTGDVLDPAFCLRTRVTLDPEETVERTFLLGVAADRAAALALIDLSASGSATRDAGAADPDTALTARSVQECFAASAREEATRRLALGLEPDEAAELERLAAAILGDDPATRPDSGLLRRIRESTDVGDVPGLRPRLVGVVPLVQTAAASRAWRALNLPINVVVPGPDGGFRRP